MFIVWITVAIAQQRPPPMAEIEACAGGDGLACTRVAERAPADLRAIYQIAACAHGASCSDLDPEQVGGREELLIEGCVAGQGTPCEWLSVHRPNPVWSVLLGEHAPTGPLAGRSRLQSVHRYPDTWPAKLVWKRDLVLIGNEFERSYPVYDDTGAHWLERLDSDRLARVSTELGVPLAISEPPSARKPYLVQHLSDFAMGGGRVAVLRDIFGITTLYLGGPDLVFSSDFLPDLDRGTIAVDGEEWLAISSDCWTGGANGVSNCRGWLSGEEITPREVEGVWSGFPYSSPKISATKNRVAISYGNQVEIRDRGSHPILWSLPVSVADIALSSDGDQLAMVFGAEGSVVVVFSLDGADHAPVEPSLILPMGSRETRLYESEEPFRVEGRGVDPIGDPVLQTYPTLRVVDPQGRGVAGAYESSAPWLRSDSTGILPCLGSSDCRWPSLWLEGDPIGVVDGVGVVYPTRLRVKAGREDRVYLYGERWIDAEPGRRGPLEVQHLIPGPGNVVVTRGDEIAVHRVELEERATVRPKLHRGKTVEGQLLRSDGWPAPLSRVESRRVWDHPDLVPGSHGVGWIETRSDLAGRFALSGMWGERWLIAGLELDVEDEDRRWFVGFARSDQPARLREGELPAGRMEGGAWRVESATPPFREGDRIIEADGEGIEEWTGRAAGPSEWPIVVHSLVVASDSFTVERNGEVIVVER